MGAAHLLHCAGSITADRRQPGPGTRRTPGWQGVLVVSGNQTITAQVRNGKHAGVPARVITQGGPFTETADEAVQLAAAVQADYGHDGPAVLAAVDVATMQERQQAALAAIGAPAGGTLGTNATQLALAVAGAMALDDIHGTTGTIAAAAIEAARDYLGTASEPQSDLELFLAAVAEMLSSTPAAWADADEYQAWVKADATVPGYGGSPIPRHGLQGTLAGLRDGEWLCIYKATFDAIVAEHGLSAHTMLTDLYRRGDLRAADSERGRGEWTTKGPRWAGRPRMYVARLTAFTVPEDDDTPQPPAPASEPAPVPEPAAADPRSFQPTLADPLAGGWGPGTIGASAQDHQDDAPPRPAPAVVVDHASLPGSPDDRPRDVQDHQADADPREAWLAATWIRDTRQYFKMPERRASLARIVTLLDEAPDVADTDAVASLADRLQLLAELEGRGQEFGGPFMPELRGRPALLRPWKRGGLPIAAELVIAPEGYGFERSYDGPVTVLDRNGAWIGAIGTTLVAHGALDHTGECEPSASGTAPGYYLTAVYPWTEPGMPSPLGTADPGTQAWVTAPTMGLLAELAAAGRWPDAIALDSWTGTPVRLDAWGRLIRELRRYALENHGYGSGAYQAAKDAVSKSVSMMKGTMAADSTMPTRVWAKCKNQRIDWRHQVITNSAVFTWRAMDRCLALAGGNPALAPIGIRSKDELLIPSAAVELVTTQNYPGGTRPPVRLDSTGIELGTFKVKGEETRTLRPDRLDWPERPERRAPRAVARRRDAGAPRPGGGKRP